MDVLEGAVPDVGALVDGDAQCLAACAKISGSSFTHGTSLGVDVCVDEVKHAVTLEDALAVVAVPDRVGQHADPDPVGAQRLPQRTDGGVREGVRLQNTR